MNCPKCDAKLTIQVNMIGGCIGHYSEDSRCYCDSPDIEVYFRCANNFIYNRSRQVCSYKKKIDELSDQDALARWLTKNYKPYEVEA